MVLILLTRDLERFVLDLLTPRIERFLFAIVVESIGAVALSVRSAGTPVDTSRLSIEP